MDALTDLSFYISSDDLKHISDIEKAWLKVVFEKFHGYPTLEQIWQLMDEPWRELQCDQTVMNDRIGLYYSHPVWLLNGLFIEQHIQSIQNRTVFTQWVAAQRSVRIADYGGGFGGLARMIGKACPTASIEVIEPHPHPLAIERARQTPNVSYQPKLTGTYDILIATDVFEHVPDPLALVAETASYLNFGGRYLIANCFHPVILCHLPQTFHLRHSWDMILASLGLEPAEDVSYARLFKRSGRLTLDMARRAEARSLKLWSLTKNLPGRIARPLTRIAFSI